jgi:hypothetical protein
VDIDKGQGGVVHFEPEGNSPLIFGEALLTSSDFDHVYLLNLRLNLSLAKESCVGSLAGQTLMKNILAWLIKDIIFFLSHIHRL